jgi:hypothetical protein
MTDSPSCRSGVEFAARRTRSDDEVVAEHCITCGDDGAEMTVLRLDASPGLAWCRSDDATDPELVEVSLIDVPAPGERILVHAGTAIASLPGSAR